MNEKNLIFKAVLIVILIIAVCMLLPNYSRAETTSSPLTWDEIDKSAKEFLKIGSNQEGINQNKIQDIVIPIAQILVAIGDVVLVIVTAVMAMKYLVSNPEDKAKLKTQLIGVAVSAFVIFGAQFIWKTAYVFFSNLAG